jgi:hypothetical protein
VQLGKAAESIFEVQHTHRAISSLPQKKKNVHWKMGGKGNLKFTAVFEP